MKKRVVVICPGRGSYTKETLGYLNGARGDVRDLVHEMDKRRASIGAPTISELDSDPTFKPSVHTKGEHASPLIYACSYLDFMAINREKFEIVAVTGNSMGWYLALAFGGALSPIDGFEVVNTMGSMMKDGIVGGQVIYPVCDANWVKSPEKIELVNRVVKDVNRRDGCEVYQSIDLGGYAVLGANRSGITALLKELPKVDDYPFQLINHAAFHTPLLRETSERAFQMLSMEMFQRPEIPLIDGRGVIWQPHSTDIEKLYKYTFGHQVIAKYDFTNAISVALKEFAPDQLILLGPGSSLGGSIGQILIENDWRSIKKKEQFTELQSSNPVLLAMGRHDQRALAVS